MSFSAEAKAAWIAGIIEGEGWISWNPKAGAPAIYVSMTDRDTVDRLFEWSGQLGSVREMKPQFEGRKIPYRWSVCSHEDVLALADMIEPYLMSRRSAKLAQLRVDLAEHTLRMADRRAERFAARQVGICKRGHDRSVVGNTSRGRCAECARENSRKAKAKAQQEQ